MQDFVGGQINAFAARVGNDAKRAVIVAPLLNLDESAAPSVKVHGFDAFKIGGGLDVGHGDGGGVR